MHKLINYIRYLLKTKGRHGTHSPFVYAFVESVLRDKRNYYAFATLKEESKLSFTSFRENKLFFRCIQFMTPSAIQLSQQAGSLKNIVVAASSAKRVLAPDAVPGSGTLSIITIDEVSESFITRLALDTGGEFSILIIGPHTKEDLWKAACSHTSVTMSLDLWSMGILCSGAAFKVKQHFRLR